MTKKNEFKENANLYLVMNEALNELAFGMYREETTETNGVITTTKRWVQSGECLLFLYKQMSARLKKLDPELEDKDDEQN